MGVGCCCARKQIPSASTRKEGGGGTVCSLPKVSSAQQACVSLMSDCGIRSKDFISAHIEFFLKVSGLREMKFPWSHYLTGGSSLLSELVALSILYGLGK